MDAPMEYQKEPMPPPPEYYSAMQQGQNTGYNRVHPMQGAIQIDALSGMMNQMMAQMNNESPQQGNTWAQPVPPRDGITPGLQCLVDLEQVIIDEHKEALNMMNMMGKLNKYKIMNQQGELLFFAEEDDTSTNFGGAMTAPVHMVHAVRPPYRAFTVRAKNSEGQEVLRIIRATVGDACCGSCTCGCPGCQVTVKVEAAGGPLGNISQKFYWGRLAYSVQDRDGKEVAEVIAPCSCCTEIVAFYLRSQEHGQFGEIRRHFQGGLNVLRVKDTFKVNFPRDMDHRTKALLISAAVLLDFALFQRGVGHNGVQAGGRR